MAPRKKSPNKLVRHKTNSLAGPDTSPETFLALLSKLNEGVLLTDLDGKILFATPKALLLCNSETLTGKNLRDILSANLDAWKEELSGGFIPNALIRPLTNDDTELLVRMFPFLENQYLLIIQDGSFINEAVRALKEGQDRYNAIFNHTVDGIITIDHHGYVEMVNPAAAKLFGYNPEDLYGKNISLLMPQPYRQNHDGYINNYMRTGQPKIIGIGREVVGKRKDGSTFPFHLSISEVNLQHRRLFTGIIHDISYQKQAEERLRSYAHELEERVQARTIELAETIKKLQESNLNLKKAQEEISKAYEKEKELSELKSRFVTTASHEFRTPLSTILSSAALIGKYEDEADQEKRIKHIQRIKSSVNNLTSILEDFLSLSKLEEGRIQVNPQEFDLLSLLQELAEELQTLLKPGQKLNFQAENRHIVLFQDKLLLRNSLINLLSNAIKYSREEGSIDINWEVNGTMLACDVRDYGMGIPQEEQEYLFTRFFRASNATNIQGTGLGLHIVKKYIELMGGEISFRSQAGEGSTFSIKIPLKNGVS